MKNINNNSNIVKEAAAFEAKQKEEKIKQKKKIREFKKQVL